MSDLNMKAMTAQWKGASCLESIGMLKEAETATWSEFSNGAKNNCITKTKVRS